MLIIKIQSIDRFIDNVVHVTPFQHLPSALTDAVWLLCFTSGSESGPAHSKNKPNPMS